MLKKICPKCGQANYSSTEFMLLFCRFCDSSLQGIKAELVSGNEEMTECFWCGERMVRLQNGLIFRRFNRARENTAGVQDTARFEAMQHLSGEGANTVNVKWTKSMVDKLVDMYISGEPIEHIAKAVGVSKWGCYEKLKTLGVLTGERLLKQECQYCGVPFMTKANSRKLYCSEKCRKAAKNKRPYANHKTDKSATSSRREYPYPLVREYTDTSDMLIAQCLLEGYNTSEMAKLFGRDEQDLAQHIIQEHAKIQAWQKRLLKKWGAEFFEARRQRREAQRNAGARVQIR